MFPSIILNKIYWYLWWLKQRDLCVEYKRRTEYYQRERISHAKISLLSANDSTLIVNFFNYRYINDLPTYYRSIYGPKNSHKVDFPCVGPLPKNYIKCDLG